MKNKILKMTFALAISSCLLFTACGQEQTAAPAGESVTENIVESTEEEVEESSTEEVVESTEEEVEESATEEVAESTEEEVVSSDTEIDIAVEGDEEDGLGDITEIIETPDTTGGGAMTELEAPPVVSDDFVVEEMERTSMYLVDDCMGMLGPNEAFGGDCYLFKGEGVSIVGVVTSYMGEECLWYCTNLGEFIDAKYLTTEAPSEE